MFGISKQKMKKRLPVALSLLALLCVLFFSCPVKRSLFASFLPHSNGTIVENVTTENHPAYCGDCHYVPKEQKWLTSSSQQSMFPQLFYPPYMKFSRLYGLRKDTRHNNYFLSLYSDITDPLLFIQNQVFLI